MIISKTWLSEYLEINLDNDQIESGLTSLGLECTTIKNNFTFTDVFVGQVEKIIKHPNADKLFICTVSINDNEKLNIVCGAPNVRANIKVPIAIVGSKLNNGDFLIKKTKIRGIKSEGMICSENELNISKSHSGIMILDDSFKIGTPMIEILSKNLEVNFELDLTPNRGDCFGHLGVARELSILENRKLKNKKNSFKVNHIFDNEILLKNNSNDACPRYTSRIIKGIKVSESPKWLSRKLESIGQKSINNIVDAANYVMMDMGHPLHTFDLNKINNKQINIRYATKNEKIKLLDNNSYILQPYHLVIADDHKPIALAGVMGDNKTGISISTTDILIESAYFNPSIIRKSAKTLGLSTEASKRFERDTDINILTDSLDCLTDLIINISGGKKISNIKDIYLNRKNNVKIQFNIDKCNKFLGTSLDEVKIKSIFKSLNIKILNDKYLCQVPSYRNDLTRAVDLYEEVARVFGYDNIPLRNTFTSNFNSFNKDEMWLQDKIKLFLMANGYYENYSNSLNDEKSQLGFSNIPAVRLSNPLSNNMEFLRTTLIPGLLKAVSYNIKRNLDNFKLFEMGIVHKYIENLETRSVESNYLGMIYVSGNKEHWRNTLGNDFFSVKGQVVGLFKYLRFNNIEFIKSEYKGFINSFLIKVENVKIGFWGKIDIRILKEHKIRNDIFALEVNYNKINNLYKKNGLTFKKPNIFPIIKRDIAIELRADIPSDKITKTILSSGGVYLIEVILFDVYKGNGVDKNNVSLAYSIKFQANDKTLTDKEIDITIDSIINKLKEEYKIKQR